MRVLQRLLQRDVVSAAVSAEHLRLLLLQHVLVLLLLELLLRVQHQRRGVHRRAGIRRRAAASGRRDRTAQASAAGRGTTPGELLVGLGQQRTVHVPLLDDAGDHGLGALPCLTQRLQLCQRRLWSPPSGTTTQIQGTNQTVRVEHPKTNGKTRKGGILLSAKREQRR